MRGVNRRLWDLANAGNKSNLLPIQRFFLRSTLTFYMPLGFKGLFPAWEVLGKHDLQWAPRLSPSTAQSDSVGFYAVLKVR